MNMAPFVLNWHLEAFDRTTNRNVVAQRVAMPLPSPSDPVIFLRFKLLRERETPQGIHALFPRSSSSSLKQFHVFTAGSCSIAVTVFCCGPWKVSADEPGTCLKPFAVLLLSKQHLPLLLLWLQKYLLTLRPAGSKAVMSLCEKLGYSSWFLLPRMSQPNADHQF